MEGPRPPNTRVAHEGGDAEVYQVAAFTGRNCRGGPAAVVVLRQWLDRATMQLIARVLGLAETAFLVPTRGAWPLRWFTPTQEVPLCGHATLAAALVAFSELDAPGSVVQFATRSGTLEVTTDEYGLLTLSLPMVLPEPRQPSMGLVRGLGRRPKEVYATRDDPNLFAIFGGEEDVLAASPDLRLLEALHPYAVAISAPGRDADFVSRYFAPSYGIPEDPVTGSIHRVLAPYWGDRLGRQRLHALQASKRGGELYCQIGPDHVLISGNASLYLRGRLRLPR